MDKSSGEESTAIHLAGQCFGQYDSGSSICASTVCVSGGGAFDADEGFGYTEESADGGGAGL